MWVPGLAFPVEQLLGHGGTLLGVQRERPELPLEVRLGVGAGLRLLHQAAELLQACRGRRETQGRQEGLMAQNTVGELGGGCLL